MTVLQLYCAVLRCTVLYCWEILTDDLTTLGGARVTPCVQTPEVGRCRGDCVWSKDSGDGRLILILILITSDCLVPGSGSLSEMKMIADWWLEDPQPQPSLYPPNKQTLDTVLRRDLRLLFWIVDWNFRLLIVAGGGGRRVCVEMWWRCWSPYWAVMEETHRGFAETQHRLQTPHPGHRWSGSDGLSNQYSSQYNWPDQRMGLWFAGLPTSKQSADANSQNSLHIYITVNNLTNQPILSKPCLHFHCIYLL